MIPAPTYIRKVEEELHRMPSEERAGFILVTTLVYAIVMATFIVLFVTNGHPIFALGMAVLAPWVAYIKMFVRVMDEYFALVVRIYHSED